MDIGVVFILEAIINKKAAMNKCLCGHMFSFSFFFFDICFQFSNIPRSGLIGLYV